MPDKNWIMKCPRRDIFFNEQGEPIVTRKLRFGFGFKETYKSFSKNFRTKINTDDIDFLDFVEKILK